MAATIHLDTSFLILATSPSSAEAARLAEWLADGRIIRMSAIAWAEFVCDPVSAREIDAAARVTRRPVAFDAMDPMLAGRLFNLGGRRRRSLPDCMIAATALNAGAALATGNAEDFKRFAPLGLVVETA